MPATVRSSYGFASDTPNVSRSSTCSWTSVSESPPSRKKSACRPIGSSFSNSSKSAATPRSKSLHGGPLHAAEVPGRVAPPRALVGADRERYSIEVGAPPVTGAHVRAGDDDLTDLACLGRALVVAVNRHAHAVRTAADRKNAVGTRR